MSEHFKEIIFVSGVDLSLVGISINGYTLKCTKAIPTDGNDIIAPNCRAYDLGHHFLGFSQTAGQGYNYGLLDENKIEYYLYFEKDNWETFSKTQHLINCLRLFQNSSIGFYCPLTVNSAGGCCAMPDVSHTYHSVYSFEAGPLKSINNISDLIKFYDETYTTTYSEPVQKMLKLFHDSFRMHSEELKLIQRVTMLEMLVDGNAELKYRIARSVAVFLGRDVDESKEIFNRTKKIYDVRSTYLHDGKTNKINEQIMFDALNLTRRVLANFLYIKCNMKEFRERIDISGFGSNPFDIKL